MTTLDEKLSALLGKYDAIAEDPEVSTVCAWVQPNTSESFDESRLDDGFEDSLAAFFALDEAASDLIKAKQA